MSMCSSPGMDPDPSALVSYLGIKSAEAPLQHDRFNKPVISADQFSRDRFHSESASLFLIKRK